MFLMSSDILSNSRNTNLSDVKQEMLDQASVARFWPQWIDKNLILCGRKPKSYSTNENRLKATFYSILVNKKLIYGNFIFADIGSVSSSKT